MFFNWFRKREEKNNQIEVILNDESLNKSEKMRRLYELGLDLTTIANYMHVRYNFVYNVVTDYLRVRSAQVMTGDYVTKKQQIIGLFEEGESMPHISQKLHTDYNYVRRVVKEHKSEINHNMDNNNTNNLPM